MRSARVAGVAAAAVAIVLLVVPSVFAARGDARPSDDTPGAVTILGARPGGGSGEVELEWEAVANATGYRVLRSDTADGAFEVAAELDVTTGAATAAADVVNVFSDQHSYIPPGGTFEGPDQSPWFRYVEYSFRHRCFRVIAFNAAGDGPASDVACSNPRTGGEPEPPTTTTTTASPSTTTTTVAPGQLQPSITVSPSTVAQGGTVTISGNVPVTGDQSCLSGGSARLTSMAGLFPPDGFGPEVPRDTNGNFKTTYTIPTDTPTGTYRIGVRCGGGNVGVSATLQVIPSVSPAVPVPARPNFTG